MIKIKILFCFLSHLYLSINAVFSQTVWVKISDFPVELAKKYNIDTDSLYKQLPLDIIANCKSESMRRYGFEMDIKIAEKNTDMREQDYTLEVLFEKRQCGKENQDYCLEHYIVFHEREELFLRFRHSPYNKQGFQQYWQDLHKAYFFVFMENIHTELVAKNNNLNEYQIDTLTHGKGDFKQIEVFFLKEEGVDEEDFTIVKNFYTNSWNMTQNNIFRKSNPYNYLTYFNVSFFDYPFNLAVEEPSENVIRILYSMELNQEGKYLFKRQLKAKNIEMFSNYALTGQKEREISRVQSHPLLSLGELGGAYTIMKQLFGL